MSVGGTQLGMNSLAEKSKELNFDEYEKKILDDNTVNMVAIEFYKDLVKHFRWNGYSVQRRWGSSPSLVIKDISPKEVEFMFGDGKLRINFNRTIFIVPIDDTYKDAIQKIIDVFDYVEDESP